jgi:hypothetical protein
LLVQDARGKNTSTIGTGVEINGDPGTIIQAGFRVKSDTNDIFTIVEQISIPASRKTTATIAAQEPGDIPLPVGNLEIVDPVIGWASAIVTNSTNVTLGTQKLTDPQLKTLRNQTLFAQGLSATGAIKAHLMLTDNVTSVKIAENLTGAAGVVDGITFTGPGIWVCVAGAATDQDVANSLHAARQGACPYDYGTNNGTPVQAPNGVPVVDIYADATYHIKFTRAVLKDVYAKVVAKKGTSSASQVAIQRAVKDYADGLVDGEEGFVVGASISAFELSGAICRLYPGLYVSKVSVAVVNQGAAAPVDADYKEEYILKPWEKGEINTGNINVTLS